MIQSKEFFTALDFMKRVHEGQKRGNGDPYGFHCIRVAMDVASLQLTDDLMGLRSKLIQCALLHDCIEDGKDPAAIEAEIAKTFGPFVCGVVKELTQDASLPKDERRKKMVDECGMKSLHAQIVKLADRLDNCSDMHTMSEKFIRRYLDETPIMIKNMSAGCEAAPKLKAMIEAIINPMILARTVATHAAQTEETS